MLLKNPFKTLAEKITKENNMKCEKGIIYLDCTKPPLSESKYTISKIAKFEKLANLKMLAAFSNFKKIIVIAKANVKENSGVVNTEGKFMKLLNAGFPFILSDRKPSTLSMKAL